MRRHERDAPGVVRALQRLFRETREHGRVAHLRDAVSRTTASRARGDGGLLSKTGKNGRAAPPRTSASVTGRPSLEREAATRAASSHRPIRAPNAIRSGKAAYRASSPALYMRCCTGSGIAASLAASSTCAARDVGADKSLVRATTGVSLKPSTDEGSGVARRRGLPRALVDSRPSGRRRRRRLYRYLRTGTSAGSVLSRPRTAPSARP